jgi:GYF domain 2
MRTWFYSRNGQQSGPVSIDELVGLAKQGELAPDDLVRAEQMAEWHTAKNLTYLQWPSPPPFPSTDPLTPFPVSQPRAVMSVEEKVNRVIIICIFSFGILILVGIATPGLRRDPVISRTNACISNLKMLEGAREQAVMDGKTNPVMADLCGPSAYIKVTPVCPASKAAYPMPALGEPFKCPNPSISGDMNLAHSIYQW